MSAALRVLVAALVLAAAPARAGADLSVHLDCTAARAGEEIVASVSIANVEGLVAFDLTVTWDPRALEVVATELSSAFAEGFSPITELRRNEARMAATLLGGATLSAPEETPLFTLTFRVVGGGSGTELAIREGLLGQLVDGEVLALPFQATGATCRPPCQAVTGNAEVDGDCCVEGGRYDDGDPATEDTHGRYVSCVARAAKTRGVARPGEVVSKAAGSGVNLPASGR